MLETLAREAAVPRTAPTESHAVLAPVVSALKDRQLLGQSLSICPLPDLPEIHTVQVQPGAVVLPEHWVKKYDCSTIVFRGLTEQPAGII